MFLFNLIEPCSPKIVRALRNLGFAASSEQDGGQEQLLTNAPGSTVKMLLGEPSLDVYAFEVSAEAGGRSLFDSSIVTLSEAW